MFSGTEGYKCSMLPVNNLMVFNAKAIKESPCNWFILPAGNITVFGTVVLGILPAGSVEKIRTIDNTALSHHVIVGSCKRLLFAKY